MSEITIMGCDGCLKAATKRRPVTLWGIIKYATPDSPLDRDVTLAFDAHDLECVRRWVSRENKRVRAEAKDAKDAVKTPATKATAKK